MEKLVVIACSTGGPKALQKVIPYLPKELDSSVLIVQHMPSGFTKSLADRLNDMSELEVVEASEGQVIERGHAYLAKGGFQLRLKHKRGGKYILSLSEESAKNGLRPCADVLFESLVKLDIKKIICVVLTGMGDDSLIGISKLHEKKDIYVITQDKETSTVYGMPKAINEAGYSDEVVPLHKVAEVILKSMEVR